MAVSTLKSVPSTLLRQFGDRQYALSSNLFFQLSKKHTAEVISPRTSSPSNEPRIVKSRFPDLTLPKTSVSDFILDGIDRVSDRVALQCGMTGRSYTFGFLENLAKRFGAALTERGFVKGDVLAMICPNLPEFGLGFVATAAVGGIVTTISPLYTANEMARQLKDCKAKFAVTIALCSETVLQAAAMTPSLKEVFVLGEAEGCTPVAGMIAEADEDKFPSNVQINPTEDLIVLPYSSGTTGLPKGVQLTHYNITSNVLQMEYMKQPLEDGATILAILPFFHIFALSAALVSNIYAKIRVITLPKFEPEMFVETLREHRPIGMFVIPPLIQFFVNSPLIKKTDFDSVLYFGSGAAPLSPALFEAFLEKISPHKIKYQEGYGLTETSPMVIAHHHQHNYILGTAGDVAPNTEAKIIDLTTGEMLGENQHGELCVRGPQIMKGYHNNPEATQETIDSEGWLRTGDIAFYDENDRFTIADRLKNLIKVKGMQVSPAELEDILNSHPEIKESAVVGVPDTQSSRFGELPKAFIVKSDDSKLTEEEIYTFVEKRVAPHKTLRGGVQFIETIPKSPTGKILHRVIKEEHVTNTKS